MTQDSPPRDQAKVPEIVFVTGASGAGRTTATHALEDLGYETIANIPLGLVPRLLDGAPPERPLALGVDVRTREFSVTNFLNMTDALKAGAHYAPRILYLDCRRDVLLRRYSETRRRHPLSGDKAPDVGIAIELDLLRPLRAEADVIIDTSELTPHDLRAALVERFGDRSSDLLSITLQSFAFKSGLPQDLDTVFDVRFLANPHWVEDLRARDGRDSGVAEHIMADPRYAPFFEATVHLILQLLPAYRSEGKSHLSIGFGCTGGQHRSVFVAEQMAKTLADAGWRVSIRHRELKRGSGPAPGS